MNLSLRGRLRLGIIIGTAILLTLFSFIVYILTKQSILRSFDASLYNTAQLLAAAIEQDYHDEDKYDDEPVMNHSGYTYDLELDVSMAFEFSNSDGTAYYQVWNSRGDTLLRSPSLKGGNLDRFCLNSDAPAYGEIYIPISGKCRAVFLEFLPRVGNDIDKAETGSKEKLLLLLARDISDIEKYLNALMLILIGATILIVFLSASTADMVTRLSLKPIHKLASRIREVREDNLTISFSANNYPKELAPICNCLDDAFTRIANSLEREKQFSTNVAHELRTPLAGILTNIEVCLLRQREADEYKTSLEQCLQIVSSMNKMVDTLLTLSKLDAGQVQKDIQEINLSDLIDGIWLYYSNLAGRKNISFTNNIPPDVIYLSDREHLGMILSNILHNAVEYTPEQGNILAEIQNCQNGIVLSISNTCYDLTEEDSCYVFDFFWRKSTSRSDTGVHCGIGLAVVKKIALLLDIKIDIGISSDVFMLKIYL